MRKLSLTIALIIGTVLLLCACSKGTQADSTEPAGDTKSENSTDSAGDTKSENSAVTQELLDLEKYSLQQQEGSDDNPGFQWRQIAKSDSGYYFWHYHNTIKYYDVSSGLLVPLCNRPNCSHADKDCNSYFASGLGDSGDTFEGNYIQFVDGYLYIIGVDTSNYVSLYQVAADGSTREKSMQLYKADLSTPSGDSSEQEFRSPEVCIHRGYAYWIDSTATPLCIHRMKLGGSKDEVIYTEEGESASTYRLEGYGDFVFFQSGHFIDEGYHMKGGIYAYNVKSGDVRLVLDGAISTYRLEGEQIFYATETGISVYDLTTGKSESVVENGIAYPGMSVDERYLYCYDYDTDTLIAYKHDGTEVTKLADEKVMTCSYGDSCYLFSFRSPEVSNGIASNVAILSVDDLESGNAKWTNLN